MLTFPLGIRYMFLSALFFALMGGCVKGAYLQGIPVLEILAARAFISLGLSYIDIKRQRISPWGKNRPLLLARGIMGTVALVCVFYTVTVLPLAEATLLQYLYPVFTAVLAFFFLKENIVTSTIVSIILSLVGLLVMVQPDFLPGAAGLPANELPLEGIVVALIGAFGTGIAYIIVRRLSATESPSVIIFYFPLVALPVACLMPGPGFVMPEGVSWFLLLAVGGFTQIAQFFLTLAIKNETAGRVTAFSYVQVVFSAVIGWFCFGEIPDLATVIGALLIVGGAVVNVLASKSQ